jgi:hypothetical protein
LDYCQWASWIRWQRLPHLKPTLNKVIYVWIQHLHKIFIDVKGIYVKMQSMNICLSINFSSTYSVDIFRLDIFIWTCVGLDFERYNQLYRVGPPVFGDLKNNLLYNRRSSKRFSFWGHFHVSLFNKINRLNG